MTLFSRGEVVVAVAGGRKEYDKQEKIQKHADEREIQQAMRRTNR